MFRVPKQYQFLLVVLLVSLAMPVVIAQPALPHPRQDQTSIQTRNTITITGKVYDASARTPLAQANVSLKGSRLGTISDQHGSFHLTLAQLPPFTIIISRLGYKSQQIEITTAAPADLDLALQPDPLEMEAIVVTGALNPVSKLESSVVLTTLSPRDFETHPARSSAEVLQSIPGFWVQSSAGEGPTEIMIRGFHQNEGSVFLKLMEDGLPIQDEQTIGLTPYQDQSFRIDGTVARVEAVRGGTAAILAGNAPGAIVNSISKTGGPRFSGEAAITGATHEMFRLDGNVGGPLAQNWRYNLGGFYRNDQGIRSAGWTANRGGQLKANLTRLFEDGFMRVYTKYLHDHDLWLVAVPYRYTNDSPQEIPGFDLARGTLYSPDTETYTAYNPDGSSYTKKASDGMSVRNFYAGAELDLEWGNGWSVNDKLRWSRGTYDGVLDAPVIAPVNATAFAGSIYGAAYEYRYLDGAAIQDPQNLNGNGLIMLTLLADLQNRLDQTINQFTLSKSLNQHHLNLGFYFSRSEIAGKTRGHLILKEVKNQPRLLDLVGRRPDGEEVFFTDHGFVQYLVETQNYDGDITLLSLFGGDEFQISKKLALDAGFRLENKTIDGRTEQRGDNPYPNPKGINFGRAGEQVIGTGVFTPFHHVRTDWAATLGANYKLAADMAVFGRVSRGYSTINYIDFISDNPLTDEKKPTQAIQAEIGYKYSAPRLSLFGSLVYADLSNISLFTVAIGPGNTLIYRTEFAGTRTVAAEIEARLELGHGLRLGMAATLQDAVFTKYDFVRPDGSVLDFSGNTPARAPNIIWDFSPSFVRKGLSIYANLRYFGRRYASACNLLEFSPYVDLLAGAAYRFRGFELSVQALNILNELAQHRSPVTDLNAPDLSNPEGTIQRASFNMPRAGRMSLSYVF